MKRRIMLQIIALFAIFIITLVLEIAPWPADLQSFKPSWLILALMYWTLFTPNKINIGVAFLLGIIWDLVLGSVLGIHALVLSIFAYAIASNHLILRNLSLWLQSLLVIIFVILIRCGIFIIELLIHNSMIFHWQEVFGAIFSGLLWPWVFFLFHKIQQRLQLQ